MLSRERAEKILTLHAAGWSVRSIADHLEHSPATIRSYINGQRTPGARAPRPSLLTEPLTNYCRRRFADDPNLRPSTLLNEVTELGFQGSRATFYREITRHQLSPAHRPADAPDGSPNDSVGPSRPFIHAPEHAPILPRSVAPITGETLLSYLTRLADANHLTLAEVLAPLPPWFSTKINNRDDRARHHMLVPATAEALSALAHLASRTPTSLARALPAFSATDARNPTRATTACHRCAARRGIHQPVPVHLPIHHKVCTRHGVWLGGDTGQPHLDLAACPEIITAQHRVDRLLRRHTPQQLMLAQQAAVNATPPWPASPAAIAFHWRHRFLVLQTTNHQRGIPTDDTTFTLAALYPDAVDRATVVLNPSQTPSGPE